MIWQPEEYRQRPTDYDPSLADRIIERIANGENLVSVCLDDRDYPLPATFLRWVSQDPALAEQYEWALRTRTEVLVEAMLMVADGYDAKKAKNQLDARKFHAERLMPAKYGPRAYQTIAPGKEEDQHGGVDYGAEVRRKLEAMAQRRQAAEQASPAK